MNFQIKKKLIFRNSGGKTRSISTQEVIRKMILVFYETCTTFYEMGKLCLSPKKNERVFSLQWNIVY